MEVSMILELAVGAVAAAAVAVSPVVRKMIREIFTRPRETSILIRDERTGKINVEVPPENATPAGSRG